MIEISAFMDKFMHAINESFGERVWFVGLQGSYARGEATETSDIDIVVILDDFSVNDIKEYNKKLDNLPHRDLICGFISGKNEILNWEPSDLFQFYFDTIPIKGNLDELLPIIDASAVERAIKIGACNIYHTCVHNMLYEKSEEILRGLYKSASFVIQAKYYKLNRKYVSRQKELFGVASPEDRIIIDAFLKLKNGEPIEFNYMSELLFDWSKKIISEI